MISSDSSFSDRPTKKRVLLQAKHKALSAIDSAAHDGNITMAEAQVLKRQVAIICMVANLQVSLVHSIWGISGKTQRLKPKICDILLQVRE